VCRTFRCGTHRGVSPRHSGCGSQQSSACRLHASLTHTLTPHAARRNTIPQQQWQDGVAAAAAAAAAAGRGLGVRAGGLVAELRQGAAAAAGAARVALSTGAAPTDPANTLRGSVARRQVCLCGAIDAAMCTTCCHVLVLALTTPPAAASDSTAAAQLPGLQQFCRRRLKAIKCVHTVARHSAAPLVFMHTW
jgi:hypothetical protein